MLTSSDFKELLKIFEKHKIRYLIVDGYALQRSDKLIPFCSLKMIRWFTDEPATASITPPPRKRY